jgi:calcium/calmodulin-dependent protein kinase I
VKLAINKRTGAKVAVKVIDKTKMSDQYKKNLQMETDILRKVRHPNIIQMSEIYETDEYLFLVMELVTGGELFDKIIEKGCYTEKEAAVLVHKIVSAIDYLHDMDICHRDLVSEEKSLFFFCFFYPRIETGEFAAGVAEFGH